MIAKNQRFKKKDSFSSIFSPAFLIIFVVVIISFLVISNFKIHQKKTQLRSQIETLKREIQILEEKNQKLKAGISESQNEEYLEKKARETLNLKKRGEEVIVVLPPKEEEHKANSERENFWQKLLEKLRF